MHWHSVLNSFLTKHSNSTLPVLDRVILSSLSSSTYRFLYLHLCLPIPPFAPPSLDSVKPIWERCRLGCLLERPTMVPSPSCHLLVPLQSAAGLPTGQFRWSAVSCHHGHPPWLPLKDNGTVSVTSGSLLFTTTLLHLWFYSSLFTPEGWVYRIRLPCSCWFHCFNVFWTIQNQVWWMERSGWGTILEGYKWEWRLFVFVRSYNSRKKRCVNV